MIDPVLLREKTDLVKASLEKRNFPLEPLWKYIEADKSWREKLMQLEELRAQRKKLAPKGKPSKEQLEELSKMSSRIKELDEVVSDSEAQLKELALAIPNVIQDSVPAGSSEEDNTEIRKVGTPRTFDFKPLPHEEIAQKWGLLDFERASKIAGSRFALYRALGARLERALMNFMLDVQTREHGYTEVAPPAIVNSQALRGTGQLPKFADDQFKIADTDFWLSPTAEVQLTNLYQNEILDEACLPLNLTAYTPCFRKEAGSYGKDMKGVIRLHQFDKVELVKFVHPEKSNEELEILLSNAEKILQKLELPYRVVNLCSGDLGFSSSKTYDIEVWFPSQAKYREISSCSNFLDFQARRGMIRYREETTKKVRYLHTLNGSGLAISRTFAAIIENYQKQDGTFQIPEALKTYIGVDGLPWAK